MSIPNDSQAERGDVLHDFLASYQPQVQELALALRALILRARHVRIAARAEAENPALRTLLETAAAKAPRR